MCLFEISSHILFISPLKSNGLILECKMYCFGASAKIEVRRVPFSHPVTNSFVQV